MGSKRPMPDDVDWKKRMNGKHHNACAFEYCYLLDLFCCCLSVLAAAQPLLGARWQPYACMCCLCVVASCRACCGCGAAAVACMHMVNLFCVSRKAVCLPQRLRWKGLGVHWLRCLTAVPQASDKQVLCAAFINTARHCFPSGAPCCCCKAVAGLDSGCYSRSLVCAML